MKHRPSKPPNFSLGIVQPKDPADTLLHAKDKMGIETSGKQQPSRLSRMVNQTMSRLNGVEEVADRNRQSLNVDLFLEQQKQKRIEYAKSLNEQFEKQRKLRQKKVYKPKQDQKDTRKKYLNEMPNLRKHTVDPTSDDPFIMMTHNLSEVGQALTELDLDQMRKAEVDRLKQGEQMPWQTMFRLADDSTKVQFASLDETGVPMIKGDIVPSDGALQLVNAIIMLSTNRTVFSTIVIGKDQLVSSGVHAFRMYKQGQSCTVFVDDYLQCVKYQNNTYVAHTHCHNHNSFWLPLLIKAYKRLTLANQVQLGNISLIEAISNLAPVQVQVIKFNRDALITHLFITVLNLMLKNQSIIGLCRQGDLDKPDSYEARVYPVKQVFITKDVKTCRIELVNPWRNKQLKTDGTQLLSCQQILKNFNRLIVIKGMPNDWSGFMFHSNFFSHGLPSSSNTEWTRNNQHSLVATKPCYVRICMKPQQVMSQQYGYLLFRAESYETMISSMNLERLLTNAKSVNAGGAVCTLYLDKGCYFIVPYTHERSYDSYVFFRFEVYMSSQETVTMMKTRHIDIKYRDISTDKDKILVDIEDKETYDKQRVDKILETKGKGNRLMSDHITLQQVVASGIQHPRPEEFFIPGLLHTFIIKQGVHVQEETSKKQHSEERPQIQREQWNQIYRQLIGVDAYSEEVNRGQMQEALNMLDESIDLANFQLGDSGFEMLLQPMMDQPIIRSINVSGNFLTDKAIVYLCYYLEKTGHTQIQSIDVSHNSIGEVGYRSLVGLKKHMPVLKSIQASHNEGISRDMVRSLRQDSWNKVTHK